MKETDNWLTLFVILAMLGIGFGIGIYLTSNYLLDDYCDWRMGTEHAVYEILDEAGLTVCVLDGEIQPIEWRNE